MWRDPWISWVFAHDILYCTMQNHACLYCMCIYATNKSCSVSYICIYPEYLNGHAMEISWNIMDDLFILCYPNIVPTKKNMWWTTAAASWVFWFEDQSNPCPAVSGTTPFVHLCVWWNAVVRMMLDCIGVKAPRRYLIHWISWDHIGTIWYHLVMTSPWFFDGPNRNRWFTYENSMVDLSMANFFRHNQMVIPRLPMWSLFWMAWSLARLLPCHRRQVLPAALSSLCRFSWPISRSPLEIEEPKMDLPSGKLT